MITDHFANDAQEVSDPDWMGYGLEHGWSLLTQDKRIRTQPQAQMLLGEHQGSAFCLSAGELAVSTRALRFDANRAAIERQARRRAVGFFVVYEAEVIRRWP
jgi:PIN like domain